MKREWIRTALATIGLISVVGCASMSDIRYESTQKARAVKQYVECGNPGCEKFPHDYKLGWLDGFYALSTGGPNCPPAVAPARYWNVRQQLKDCDGRRHSYYSGWQDGATRASQFPDTHHLKIFETCECTVPRCEMACGNGSCGPCGAGILGAPAYDQLIESSQDYSYQAEGILVPPAPVTPFESGTEDDGDSDEKTSDEEQDEQDEEDSSGEEKVPTAEKVDEPTEEEVSVSVPTRILEVPTGELVHDQVSTAGRAEMVEQNDAGSLFGSAFDLTSSRHSMVEHQTVDPIQSLPEKTVTREPSAASATPRESTAHDTPVQAPSDVVEQSDSGFIVPVTPPTFSNEPAVAEEINDPPSAESLGQQTPRIVVPQPTIKKVDEAPVHYVESVKLTKQDSSQTKRPVSGKPASVDGAPQHSTLPVKFEMIESNTATIELAK